MAAASELNSKEGKKDYYDQMNEYIKEHIPDRHSSTYIYPRFLEKNCKNEGNIKGQEAERLVYNVLKEIKDQPMLILYSYMFPVARNGEIDFLLVHLRKGVIILEVKAWEKIKHDKKAEAESKMQKKLDGVKIKLEKSKLIKTKFLHKPRCGFVLPNISNVNIDGYCFKENLQNFQTFMKWLDDTFDDIEHHGDDIKYQDLFDKSLCALFNVAYNTKSYDGITEELLLLTPEQCQAVDGCPCEQVIVGPAGSGKTEVLVNKVSRDELRNQEKLVICYNRALSNHLRNRLKKVSKVTVWTFDKLFQKINGNFREYQELKKLTSNPDYWRGKYESVFIDEAQDLRAGWQGWPLVFYLPLAAIFNLSLENGVFPNIWKIARVTSVFETGSKTGLDNYRPISILSVFLKLNDKTAHDQVSTFLKENSILSKVNMHFVGCTIR